jgi:hypothetical protein
MRREEEERRERYVAGVTALYNRERDIALAAYDGEAAAAFRSERDFWTIRMLEWSRNLLRQMSRCALRDFLARLRQAKDKAEFDQFMTERRNRSSEQASQRT